MLHLPGAVLYFLSDGSVTKSLHETILQALQLRTLHGRVSPNGFPKALIFDFIKMFLKEGPVFLTYLNFIVSECFSIFSLH